jgi:dolichol-phosphate mannosyltransferase
MRAIVVIPTFNECQNIETLIDKIHYHAPNLHVLIVDDNSPDGTGKLADELSMKAPGKIFVLHREQKEGLGRAYVDGFSHVLMDGYQVILQMDADLSHDPSYLPVFLDEIQHYDLVLGSRYMNGISVVNWDLKRLIISKMATTYAKQITHMPFTDITSGFKCWRRDTLASIKIDHTFSNGYLFQIETTYKAFKRGFCVKEIPIIFFERGNGKSKFNLTIIFEAIFGVLKLRFKY